MRFLMLAAVAALVPSAAPASSPGAWETFRADVKAQCLVVAKRAGMRTPEVIVHPFGTQGHGIAVLREGTDKRICLYNKRDKTVELT